MFHIFFIRFLLLYFIRYWSFFMRFPKRFIFDISFSNSLCLTFCICGVHSWLSVDVECSDFDLHKTNFCTFGVHSVVMECTNSELFTSDSAPLGPQTPFCKWYRRLSSRVKVLRHYGHDLDLPRLSPFSHAFMWRLRCPAGMNLLQLIHCLLRFLIVNSVLSIIITYTQFAVLRFGVVLSRL